MNMYIPTFVLASIILSACSSLQSSPPVIQKISTNTSIPFIPTNAIQSTPTVEQETLEEVNYDSPLKDVNLRELNLPANFLLIVQDKSKHLGVLKFDTDKIQQLEVSSDIPDSYTLKASPSGRNIAYISKVNDTAYLDVNTLADNKWVLISKIKIPNHTFIFQWITDRLIAIWGQSDSQSCPNSVALIDISTSELTYPQTSFPMLLFPQECERLPALSHTGKKIVYPAWKAYDFETGKTENILPGVTDIDPTSPTLDFKWTDKGLSIIKLNSNILSFVLNVPTESLLNSNISTGHISLPGLAEAVIWSAPKWWSFDGNLIGLDLISTSIDPKDFVFANKVIPTNFYLLNLEKNKLINYHLDRSKLNENESGEVRFTFASPDERFLAWTIYDINSGTPIAIRVMNLSNGATALIRDVEVLGWGNQTR